jgi:hypothetical protein
VQVEDSTYPPPRKSQGKSGDSVKKDDSKLGVVAHACNLSTGETEAGGSVFEARRGWNRGVGFLQ